MKTLAGMGAPQRQNECSKDWGLVICTRCGEMIDTLPTDGVKIFHSYCGRDECRKHSST
ncbi:GapA-binding peptide SR1P [Paenibacillus sp. JSM ZJ436]|uniref:GapA-binding peptide SR1P n=1 Tax=Paenibacillus TaxID=44249 RepID=UPI001E55A4D1|nr:MULTISPECIES: GapA-binding peptide SR1P [Paenibacillus]